MQVLLTQYCPMLLYLGHLIKQGNWSGETANTGVFGSEGFHTGQAFAEEFCESLLSSLVTKKGQNRGAVTIDDVDDLYHLITIRKEGHRVNVCKIPNSFVNSVRQRFTAYLNAERVYVPWVRWCGEPTSAIQAHWPRRGVPSIPPSLLIPKASDHYKQVLVSAMLVLTQQGPLKAGFRRKWWEQIPQRSVLQVVRKNSCGTYQFCILSNTLPVFAKNASHTDSFRQFQAFLILRFLRNRLSSCGRMASRANKTGQELVDTAHDPEE